MGEFCLQGRHQVRLYLAAGGASQGAVEVLTRRFTGESFGQLLVQVMIAQVDGEQVCEAQCLVEMFAQRCGQVHWTGQVAVKAHAFGVQGVYLGE